MEQLLKNPKLRKLGKAMRREEEKEKKEECFRRGQRYLVFAKRAAAYLLIVKVGYRHRGTRTSWRPTEEHQERLAHDLVNRMDAETLKTFLSRLKQEGSHEDEALGRLASHAFKRLKQLEKYA